MIDTHQELVLALSEAAELEHSLICQYLFAAYSLKTDSRSDAITAADADVFGRWQEMVLTVARQEMGHLGTVWNLAAVIGATASSARANFPQAASSYYPPQIGFFLEPFGMEALSRFIDFERPELPPTHLMKVAAPDPLKYRRVGDLYRQIRQCVVSIPDQELLVNTRATEDQTSWSNNVTLKTASTRDEMLLAIDFILAQGEGTSGAAENSHFFAFSKIRAELEAHLRSGGAVPARPTVANLATQIHRDAPGANLIDHPVTARCVDLFNSLYGTLLNLLRQYYAFSGETEDQRLFLRNAAYQVMHGCMSGLGRSLSSMPAWKDGKPGTAGPSFELYGNESLLTIPALTWGILARRMRSAQAEAEELASLAPAFGPILATTASGASGVAELLEQGLTV